MTMDTSSTKVQYELRACKQVERRMLIDAMHILTHAGFPVRSYKYTGFGAIYFVDFILFHKLLGIKRMTSIEGADRVRKRAEFNKPYDFITIDFNLASDSIPALDPNLKHLLWLDYDSVLSRDKLTDVLLAMTYLSEKSIFLVTVDIEPPGKEEDGPSEWMRYFYQEAPELLGTMTSVEHYSKENLARVNINVLSAAISSGISGRTGMDFLPLFSFVYADGHRMLTIGGMIGGESERSQLDTSDELKQALYIRRDFKLDPYLIRVPKITRKERHILDRAMPCADGWAPSEFEFDANEAEAYREIYKFFPAYAELLL